MRFCLVFCVVFSFLQAPSYAQMSFKDPNGALHYRIDISNHDLWRENETGHWEKVLELTFAKVNEQELPNNLQVFSFDSKGHFLLLVEGTGQVYNLDLVNKKFTREDRTYYRGNNFGSIRFIRRDTIYCLGGQGFWSTNNIESYFSSKTKEWELYNLPSPFGPNRIRKDYGGYDNARNLISVIEFPPIYQTPTSDHHYRYFEKPFQQKDWSYKGDLNVSLLKKLGISNFESTFIQGIYFFQNGPLLVMGNPEANEIYQINQVIPQLNKLYDLTEKNGIIYSYHVIKNGDGKAGSIKLDSISIQQLKALGVLKGKFYVPSYNLSDYSLLAGILVVIISSIFLIIRFKKKPSVLASPNVASDSNASTLDGLPEGAFRFLYASLTFPKGHHFSSQSFNELMGYSNYSYETQRQVRSKLIKAINSYFSVHYKMHDIIIRKTAIGDKRFSDYCLSEVHYERLKVLLGVE